MKKLIALIVTLISIISASAQAETFHGTWEKPVYSVDGLATMSVEIMKYDLDVPTNSNIGRIMEVMPPIIGMTALQGKFSNLEEFQALVNRALADHGAPYRNFRIIDIIVDER